MSILTQPGLFDVTAPGFSTRPAPKVPTLKKLPRQNARTAIGTLEPGVRILGFTKGQFSLIDLIVAVLDQTGPADVTVSVWSVGETDAQAVGELRRNNKIRTIQLLLDRGFLSMRTDRTTASSTLLCFGRENIRIARNHAKFVLIRNEQWNICIRCSMNLNRNPRFEQFDIDDSAEICDWMQAVVTELFEALPAGLETHFSKLKHAFQNALGGGISSDYAPICEGEDLRARLDRYRKEIEEQVHGGTC